MSYSQIQKLARRYLLKLSTNEDSISASLPTNFDAKLNHYLGQKNNDDFFAQQDFRMTLRELESLAEGDDYTWAELGKYYDGWTPAHVALLLQKLL